MEGPLSHLKEIERESEGGLLDFAHNDVHQREEGETTTTSSSSSTRGGGNADDAEGDDNKKRRKKRVLLADDDEEEEEEDGGVSAKDTRDESATNRGEQPASRPADVEGGDRDEDDDSNILRKRRKTQKGKTEEGEHESGKRKGREDDEEEDDEDDDVDESSIDTVDSEEEEEKERDKKKKKKRRSGRKNAASGKKGAGDAGAGDQGASASKPASPLKRRGGIVQLTDDQKSAIATDIVEKMESAWSRDLIARKNGKPALAKLALLPEVVDRLSDRQLEKALVSHDVGSQLYNWLRPSKSGTLPNEELRTAIIRLATRLPFSQKDMIECKLGKVLNFLRNHREETRANKRAIKAMMDSWIEVIRRAEPRDD